MIVLQNVTKKYGEVVALRDITVSVARGEFVFLVGTNGAGKTTLLKLIIREEQPESGTVLVNGMDIIKVNRDGLTKLRRKVGVVFQDTRLLPNATVAENVALPLLVQGYSQREVRAAVDHELARVALDDKTDRFPGQLSGGEQRKVAIARATVSRPDILLCDEPTDSLSPERAREIIELLFDIHRDGVTTVVASHDQIMINSLRRRVIHMEAGQIHADTPVGVFDAS